MKKIMALLLASIWIFLAQAQNVPEVKVYEGTCIGDKAYYFGRKTKEGVNYAIGSYIMFYLEYEKLNIK